MNSHAASQRFLGVGWKFPICATEGALDLSAYEEDIRESIRIILGTDPGERVMRPDFGAGLRAFVFKPVDPTTLNAIRTRVEEALVDWEPRIDVERVTVTTAPSDTAKVLIDVRYRVRSTNTQANLVYPFYLQEGTAR